MKDDEKKNRRMTEALNTILAEWRKGLYTAMPATIASYNPSTKRADVQPAIRTQLREGEPILKPVLTNIPVLFPSGGGWALAFNNLPAGEPVMLLFSQRGIGHFKKSYGVENPSGGVMQMDGAVAIAGFGALSIAPPDGIALQNDNGTIKVDLSDDGCNIDIEGTGGANLKKDGSVDFANGATITTDGDFVTKNGISLDSHVHNIVGVMPGGATIESEEPTEVP